MLRHVPGKLLIRQCIQWRKERENQYADRSAVTCHSPGWRDGPALDVAHAGSSEGIENDGKAQDGAGKGLEAPTGVGAAIRAVRDGARRNHRRDQTEGAKPTHVPSSAMAVSWMSDTPTNKMLVLSPN